MPASSQNENPRGIRQITTYFRFLMNLRKRMLYLFLGWTCALAQVGLAQKVVSLPVMTTPEGVPPVPKVGEILLNEGDYYLVRGEQLFIRRDAHRMVVRFKETAFADLKGKASKAEQQKATLQSVLDVPVSEVSLSVERLIDKRRMAIIRAHPNTKQRLPRPRIEKIGLSPQVEFAHPLFIARTGLSMLVLSDEVLVRFAPEYGKLEVSAFCAVNNLSLVRRTRGQLNVYVLRLNHPKSRSCLEVANSLNGMEGIVWAEPNFLVQIKYNLNDPLYGDQWHLNNTGQGGGTSDADVDAPEGWALQPGDPNIVIAIIDSGVDLGHEDLEIWRNPGESGGGKENNGLDDDGNGYVDDYIGWDFYSNDNDPSPGGSHGTACAGVAAAKGDNGVGVAGVAHGCEILPVKITLDDEVFPEHPYSEIGEAIEYAADRADVISCSWSVSQSGYVEDAIDYAVTSGRGGLGSTVLFATGNGAARGWTYGGITGFPAGWQAHGWEYQKDSLGVAGEDAAWVDDVTLQDGSLETFNSVTPPALPGQWYLAGDASWTTVDDPSHAHGGTGNSTRSGAINNNGWSRLYVYKDYPVGGGYYYYVWVDAGLGDGLYTIYWTGSYWAAYDYLMGEGISFPANYGNSIAVGACTNLDMQANYSQYGDEVDFVAPSSGGTLAITTTDRTGAAGYSATDYTSTFGGTSAATPLAAGVAALMLSKNPNLTAGEVRTIMRNTCDKIGSDPYVSGWNMYYGYGRINAYVAISSTPQLPKYVISGSVAFAGSGLADVNMAGLPGTPITDANGDYSAQVDHGWSGTVTPTKAEYTFEPNSVTYTNVTTDYTNQDYTASLVKYTISGRVTVGGAGLSDVNMVGLPGTAVTDSNGNYSAQVDSGWSGTVIPTKAEYDFAPNSIAYTNVASDYTNQDYAAALIKYTVSGRVTFESSGLADVNMPGLAVSTDANGDYVTEVNSGWSGTVAPTKAGYIFEPISTTYVNVTANQAQDYTAELRYPATFEWTNAGYDNSWCTAENWQPDDFNLIGMLPGPNDTAMFSMPQRGPVIDCDVDVGDMEGPLGTQTVDVIGGTVVVQRYWNWRDGTGTGTINIAGTPIIKMLGGGVRSWRAPDNGTGIINISGDPNIYVEGAWRGADETGTFIVNMSGGYVDCEDLTWGDEGGGELKLDQGVIAVREDLSLGGARSAELITINMKGGLITVKGRFLAPSNINGRCEINLYGGTIDCNEFVHGSQDRGFSNQWHLNITQGEMIIDGDVAGAIDANVSAGRISAYGGAGMVLADYDISNPGKTTVIGLSYLATAPSPEDGAENVCSERLELSWKPGLYAAMHDVYFDTDFNSVSNANDPNVPPGRGRQDANSYIPGELLELGQIYYWRIDEVNGPNTWRGEVWSFTVESGQARDPSPSDGLRHVATDQILYWTPSCLAGSHDVYLGTNWSDVNDANASSDEYKGSQDYNSYDPCGLEVGLIYYWRIDEVNGPNTWQGNVWSFTAEDVFVVVDDMEPYGELSNVISDTWFDGFSNGTGSAVSLGSLSFGDPVYDGNRSMVFEYDNTADYGAGYYSQTEANSADLQVGSDWTVQGVRELTLWFYGNADDDSNATEQMYIGLEDSSSMYAEVRYLLEDMNDIKKEEWQEWSIKLQEFTDVNLTDVNKVYIGFGDRSNPTVAGGNGVVYFDDIRLYRVGRGIWIISHSPSGYTIGPIDYVDVTFSSDVNESSLTVADINMVGPSGKIVISDANYQGGNVWRISFPEQSTQGEYHLYIGPHIEDVNGNEMDQDANRILGEDPEDIYDAYFVLTDSTPPTVISITRQTPSQELSNASQVIFAVVFSENVTGVQMNNFSIDATGDQLGATIQSASGSDANWMVTVDTAAGDGSLSIDLDQNLTSITDLTELPLTEAFTSGENYNIDRTAPTVMLDSAAPDPANTSPIPVTVTLSEGSTDFNEADITPTNATISGFSGSGASYSFNLVPAGQGLVTATVQAGSFTDAAGNRNVASSPLSRTYDSVPPAITLDSGASDPTNLSPIAATAILTEPSINFTAEDVNATNAMVSDFSGSAASYSFDLVPAGQGLVTATVETGSFTDAAGNWNVASSPLSRTYDSVSPVVTSVAVVTGLSVDVTFSEPMGAGATEPGNYTVSGSGHGSLSDNPDTVWLQDGTTYRLTWYCGDMIGGGDITISVQNVYDPAGNLIGAPNSGTHVGSGIPDTPTVIYFNPPDGSRITTWYLGIIVAFSEEVVGVDGSDMVLSGPAAAGAYVNGARQPSWIVENAWVFDILDLTTEGALNISLAPDPNDIEDLAGNDLPNRIWSYEVVFSANNKIYWTNTGYGKIERADTDGNDREVLVAGLSSPHGIAIDASGGKIYWTDPNTDTIQRANLDGSAVSNVITTGLTEPTGIAVDPYHGKLYWTEPTTGRVRRANLDGTGVEDIVTDLNSPTGITRGFRQLYPPEIWWTDVGTGKVQRANLDGSDVEDVITSANSPTGIGFRPYRGVYLADFGAKKIQAWSGSDLLDLVTGLSGPWDIAANGRYDNEHMYMYWTDIESNKIQRANIMDYGGAEDIITFGLSTPSGIAFYNEPLTYFVDDDANGANNGTSWADAFTDLECALLAAQRGDEIWVAEGTYRPSQRTHGDDPRTARFWLRSEVALYGGFPSGGGTWEERNPGVYRTVLSGDLAGNDLDAIDPCDLLAEPTRAENAYHVLYTGSCHECLAVYEMAVLDGFIITGGNANGDPNTVYASTIAGGMMQSGRPTIRNCVFTGNSAIRAGAFHGDGAIITNCIFRENAAYEWGGAIDGAPTLISCSFIRNFCKYMGGAFYGTALSPILNCTFRENSAKYGGAVSMSGCSPLYIPVYASCPSIKNCTFIRNVAETAGGGIHCWQYTLELSNCTLRDNMAPEGAQIAVLGGSFDTAAISYSNVQSSSNQVYILSGLEPIWAEGNIDLDPLLTPDGHLRSGSPCINLGDPNFTSTVDTPYTPDLTVLKALTDIDGEDRVMDGRMDIGSDEFLDSDGDGLPDWWEQEYFGDPIVADPNSDPDTDGLTNLEEYEFYGGNPNASPYQVPGEFGTIQEAINAAQDGDTVLVASATYAGIGNYELDYGGKSVIVFAPAGATIDCGNMGRAVNMDSARGTFAVLQGFTITNGSADVGGGIRMKNSRFMFKDCVLTGNTATDKVGGIYCSVSSPTLSNLTVQDNPAPNEPNAGLIEFSNIDVQGNLTIEAGRLDIYSSSFDGIGQIYLDEGTLLKITPTTSTGRAGPTVIRTDVNGLGDIEVDAGQQLIIEGDAIVNLSGSSECNPDANTGGFITVDGSMIIRGSASLVNTNVDVKLCEFEGNNNIQYNNILLLESSEGFGGQFYVSENATIYCNTIISEGDRYLDLDPDPSDRNLNIAENRIIVIIKEGTEGSQGTLLELRAADYDCNGPNNPDCTSGAYQIPADSPGFTEDPSENWVLESLILEANAKLNLTNRQGFEFQDFTDPNIGDWETVYVKELVMGPNAILNTGLQTLYYQSLVDLNGVELIRDPNNPFAPLANGSRFQDIPLLGFSLGIIAMDDTAPSPHNEFDIRVRLRLRDPNDVQPEAPDPPREGSIERIEDDPEIPEGAGGVMEMQTQALGVWSANSVAAKGAFARAGDEEITVEFQYMFVEDPCNEAELIVYLSDDPEVSQNLVEVARIRSPNEPNQPGWIESGQFAVFSDTFARGGLNFNRGTYIELELRGKNTRCWIDNWDPAVRFASYIVIDDMESYTPGWDSEYPISNFAGSYGWDCGVTNGTGSLLVLETSWPVRGEKSMAYTYDNTLYGYYYSEISNHFVLDPCDWTASNVRSLALWFCGDVGNDANDTEQMYVGLEDSTNAYGEVRYPLEEMGDVRLAEWQQWNILLSDFGGVNLASLEKLYVGFGDRTNTSVYGGSGTVHFDDVYLYEPTCRPSLRSEEFAVVDVSGDCVIDMADLGILAGRWLTWSQVGDIHRDLWVDFRDYAILAGRWLEEEGMWP